MNIRTILSGNEEVLKAKEVIVQIGEATFLKPKKQKKLNAAKKVVFRHHVKLAAIVGALLFLFTPLIYLGYTSFRTYRTEKRIEDIEQSFEDLKKEHWPLVEKHVTDKILRERISQSFYLVENNKKNPYKNQYKRPKEVKHDACLYTYVFKETEGLGAGFASADGAIVLGPNFNTNNLLQLSILFHEIVHLRQQVEILLDLQHPQKIRSYMNFYIEASNRIVLGQEIEAYCLQIEMINAITDGYLKKTVERNEEFDLEFIAKKLHTSTYEIGERNYMFIEMCRFYYQDGGLRAPNFLLLCILHTIFHLVFYV